MKILSFKDFMKKYILNNDTMNESELQKSYIHPIYPRGSTKYSDEGFVNFDVGSQQGTHWTAFCVEKNKSYYFDSFRGNADKFHLKQLPKTLIYHNYTIEDMNSNLCGTYCLYFFPLIERTSYYDAISKTYFEKIVNE